MATSLLGLQCEEQPASIDRAAIAAYADAVGDANPLYRDADAAQASGYRDVIAPPTGAAMLFIQPLMALVAAAGDRIDFAHLVHGEQSYAYERPIVAGEPLRVAGRIAQEYSRAGHLFLVVESWAKDAAGHEVVRGSATLVVRGGGEK